MGGGRGGKPQVSAPSWGFRGACGAQSHPATSPQTFRASLPGGGGPTASFPSALPAAQRPRTPRHHYYPPPPPPSFLPTPPTRRRPALLTPPSSRPRGGAPNRPPAPLSRCRAPSSALCVGPARARSRSHKERERRARPCSARREGREGLGGAAAAAGPARGKRLPRRDIPRHSGMRVLGDTMSGGERGRGRPAAARAVSRESGAAGCGSVTGPAGGGGGTAAAAAGEGGAGGAVPEEAWRWRGCALCSKGGRGLRRPPRLGVSRPRPRLSELEVAAVLSEKGNSS